MVDWQLLWKLYLLEFLAAASERMYRYIAGLNLVAESPHPLICYLHAQWLEAQGYTPFYLRDLETNPARGWVGHEKEYATIRAKGVEYVVAYTPQNGGLMAYKREYGCLCTASGDGFSTCATMWFMNQLIEQSHTNWQFMKKGYDRG